MDILRMKKNVWLLLFVMLTGPLFAAAPAVRIKDIAIIREARENQLMGFGLVVGLQRTGDSQQTEFTKQALTNMLSKMGVSAPFPMGKTNTNPLTNLASIQRDVDYKSRNIAAVMVTGNLPAFIKPGQKIDVNVSSIGDAASLKGGTLLATPLMGLDGNIYAVGQGQVSMGNTSSTMGIQYASEVGTTARIPSGAIVEKEVPVSFQNYGAEGEPELGEERRMQSTFTLILKDPDFTTASRVAVSIARKGVDAKASDASTIIVNVPRGRDIVALISQIENLTVIPDVTAKIVINEKTGTIVIGENVKIFPVAISYGNISVSVGGVQARTPTVTERTRPLTLVQGARLGDLIRSLNAIGAKPKDVAAILQAIKAAGALAAEIEFI